MICSHHETDLLNKLRGRNLQPVNRIETSNRIVGAFARSARYQFKGPATHSIGSEPINVSPAISDGTILIRRNQQLSRIGKEQQRSPAGSDFLLAITVSHQNFLKDNRSRLKSAATWSSNNKASSACG